MEEPSGRADGAERPDGHSVCGSHDPDVSLHVQRFEKTPTSVPLHHEVTASAGTIYLENVRIYSEDPAVPADVPWYFS